MNLEVIRHKTAKEFFEGFYLEEQVDSYAYQLERMFEQGSAVEGDYFVVFDKDKPLLSLEIYRNNTRRVLEKMPMIAIGRNIGNKDYIKAMTLIFDHLSEDIMYGYTPKLEIAIREDHEFYNELKNLFHKYSYKPIIRSVNYTVDPKVNYDLKLENYNFKKFIEYEIDDRYSFISNSTYSKLHTNLSTDKLYMDFLEEGYQSEELWETISKENKIIGHILPVFLNGLKNSIRMIDYGSNAKNSERLFYEATISRLIEIAKKNDVEDITIDINSSDKQFIDIANELNLIENHITEKFIKV